MPMYEYRCRDCGTVSEFLVGVSSDEPRLECGSCGSRKLNRMISVMNFTMGSKSSTAVAPACGCAEGSGGCGGGECACGTA